MQENSLGMMQIVNQVREEEQQKAIEKEIDENNKAMK